MNEEDIIEMESRLIQAIKASDTDALDKMLHNDLLFMAPNGQIISKEMDLASHRAGEMKVEHLISTIEDVKIMGDNAIVVVVYETRGTMLGRPMQGKFRYIRIWKIFTDEIKVIGGSCCAIS